MVRLALAAAIALTACAGPVAGLFPPGTDEPTVRVHVVAYALHTGIVIRRADIPPGIWPEHRDVGDGASVEVGWGDREFYMTPQPTSGMAVSALMMGNPSVLLAIDIAGPVERYLAPLDSAEIALSAVGFHELLRFIQDAYVRDAQGRPQPLGPGLFPRSRFYAANGRYHMFNTCNTWVARALRQAGCPIRPGAAMTAGMLMTQIERFGRVSSAQ
jgi:uncharacterized protein (TIGR02117 family)